MRILEKLMAIPMLVLMLSMAACSSSDKDDEPVGDCPMSFNTKESIIGTWYKRDGNSHGYLEFSAAGKFVYSYDGANKLSGTWNFGSGRVTAHTSFMGIGSMDEDWTFEFVPVNTFRTTITYTRKGKSESTHTGQYERRK